MIQTEVARTLADDGYDVLRASDIGESRADDSQILETAISLNRILITLDNHFGDWAVLPLSKQPGVIRIKANPTSSKNILNVLLPFLRMRSPDEFNNHLVIVSDKKAKWIKTV